MDKHCNNKQLNQFIRHIHGTENKKINLVTLTIFSSALHIHNSQLQANVVTFFAPHSQLIPTGHPLVTTDLVGNEPISYCLTTDYVCWLVVVSGMCAPTYIKNTGGQHSILQLEVFFYFLLATKEFVLNVYYFFALQVNYNYCCPLHNDLTIWELCYI